METRSARKRRKQPYLSSEIREAITVQPENLRLLTLFPEEVWRLILANVDNATDYYNICGASPLFKDILYPRRTLILFPDVWQILMKQLQSLNVDWHWNWDEVVPHPFDDPNRPPRVDGSFFKDLFVEWKTIREVCQSWKNGVDKSYENLDYQFKFAGEQKELRFELQWCVNHDVTTVFGSRPNAPQRFLTHFNETHGSTGQNPFILRKLKLKLPSDQDEYSLAYVNSCLEVVRNYGKHIWYLNVTTNVNSFAAQLRFYNRLKEFVQYLPNLKVLQFEAEHSLTHTEAFQDREIHNSDKNQATSNINSITPFPQLPKLQFIDQNGMYLPLFMEILKPNLATVKQLGITVSSVQEFCALSDNRLPIPVTKLLISMPYLKVSWREIFSVLKINFGKTVEEMEISLPAPNPFDITDRLILPKIRILKLNFEKAAPLDLVLGMRNTLEILQVRMSDKEKRNNLESREDKIKFYRHFHIPKRSNIWEKLPKLQQLGTRHVHHDYGDETVKETERKQREIWKRESEQEYEKSLQEIAKNLQENDKNSQEKDKNLPENGKSSPENSRNSQQNGKSVRQVCKLM